MPRAPHSVAQDYLVGTILVLILLAISFALIRLLGGVVEPEVERVGAAPNVPAPISVSCLLT